VARVGLHGLQAEAVAKEPEPAQHAAEQTQVQKLMRLLNQVGSPAEVVAGEFVIPAADKLQHILLRGVAGELGIRPAPPIQDPEHALFQVVAAVIPSLIHSLGVRGHKEGQQEPK